MPDSYTRTPTVCPACQGSRVAAGQPCPACHGKAYRVIVSAPADGEARTTCWYEDDEVDKEGEGDHA